MRPKDSNRIEDARYFTGVDQLTEQIQVYRRGFFNHPDGSLSDEYVSEVGLNARNMIVDGLSGSELHLEYGVLTGLAMVLFTPDPIRIGLESHLGRVEPEEDNPSTIFLKSNIPSPSETEIDDRFLGELTPTMEALAEIYGFDSECAQSARARESIVSGFIAGANTIISMCDDWESWIRLARMKLKQEHEGR